MNTNLLFGFGFIRGVNIDNGEMTLVCCSSNGETKCEVFNEWLIGNYMPGLRENLSNVVESKFNINNVPLKFQFVAAER